MDVSPDGRSNGGVGVTGGGDVHLPSLENSHTVHCDQALYGPGYGGGEASRFTGGQAVVGTESIVKIGDADSGSGGRTGGGGGEDEQDG